MGRLMLNVLLSFAQFEREITGERIRDKIAASKKKGMWMGGFVPLGYDAVDRKLVINAQEARTVQTLFSLYLKLRNVKTVWTQAAQRGLKTKIRRNAADVETGGQPFWRGHIYKILRNPIYAGWIAHHGELYDGEHAAIVDQDSWAKVQELLTANARRKNIKNGTTSAGLLIGLLYDSQGRRMTHSHASKKQRRYRYYATNSDAMKAAESTLRIPADQIESRVKETLVELLQSPTALASKLCNDTLPAKTYKSYLKHASALTREFQQAKAANWAQYLRTYLSRVVIETDALCLIINRSNLADKLAVPISANGTFEHRVPCHFANRGGQLKLIVRPEDESQGGIDEALIRSVARAHGWFEQLQSGQARSIRAIADQEDLSTSYVMRYLRLAFLAPDIVEAILDGRQPPGISVRKLTNNKQLPSNWAEQRQLLNFPAS